MPPHSGYKTCSQSGGFVGRLDIISMVDGRRHRIVADSIFPCMRTVHIRESLRNQLRMLLCITDFGIIRTGSVCVCVCLAEAQLRELQRNNL